MKSNPVIQLHPLLSPFILAKNPCQEFQYGGRCRGIAGMCGMTGILDKQPATP